MQIQEITVGTMISINELVNIPNNWIKRLTDSDIYAVLLKNNPSMFRIITTVNPVVTEFYLDLEILEEDFLELMFKKIEKHKIKPLYSSGVCFYDDTCYYLFIIDGDCSDISESVSTTLKEIQGVKDVIIKTYSINRE